MIDLADLPAAVQRAVRDLDTSLTNTDAATRLRLCAVHSYSAIGWIWNTSQWHQVHEQLALIGGYLTAAQRLEEETTP